MAAVRQFISVSVTDEDEEDDEEWFGGSWFGGSWLLMVEGMEAVKGG